MFNEETGNIDLGRDLQPEERIFATPPMCQTTDGCPKGTPENPRSLTDANECCYQHYLECKAVGEFPDEPVVRRNAAAIREIEEKFARYEQQKSQSDLIQLVMVKKQ